MTIQRAVGGRALIVVVSLVLNEKAAAHETNGEGGAREEQLGRMHASAARPDKRG